LLTIITPDGGVKKASSGILAHTDADCGYCRVDPNGKTAKGRCMVSSWSYAPACENPAFNRGYNMGKPLISKRMGFGNS